MFVEAHLMEHLKSNAGVIACERVIGGVAVNPADPPGISDPIRRSTSELALWRGRPYVSDLPHRQSLHQASFVPKSAEGSRLQIASQHHITGWPDAPESVAG